MKKLPLFFMLLFTFVAYSQVHDSFDDGDFHQNPVWSGISSAFTVNLAKELQSTAKATSVSWLSTPSVSIDNAVWQCKIKITYPTSASNFACFYVIADNDDLLENCNAYFIQVGGTNDEVSLYYQQGSKKTKIIDGKDKRTDGNPIELIIRLTRTPNGLFELSSKLTSETDFYTEGSVQSNSIQTSDYCGVLYSNTSTTGTCYYFDDINITGTASIDSIAPLTSGIQVVDSNSVSIAFSENINTNEINYVFENDGYAVISSEFKPSTKELILKLNKNIERGTLFVVSLVGCKDMSGNALVNTKFQFALTEQASFGDVLINEIMFDAPENGDEYVELINVSNKILDINTLKITIRKTDGTLQSLCTADTSVYVLAGDIFVFTPSPELVVNNHKLQSGEGIYPVSKWNTLNNDGATLVVCANISDSILDELTYSKLWHYPLLANTKGVALERISTFDITQWNLNWHSAASDYNYGTPGFENSQHFEPDQNIQSKVVWCEPSAFSPDNDGNEDISYIYISSEYAGFVANLRVFSRNGECVKILANNLLLSKNTHFIWNGITDKGKLAQTGIYMIYVELFHPEKRTKIQHKTTLVITSR